MTGSAKKDKIITQMTLHQYALHSSVHPLVINGMTGGYKLQSVYSSDPDAFANSGARGGQKFQQGLATGPVVFCSGLSANGSAFLQQMSLEELIPV